MRIKKLFVRMLVAVTLGLCAGIVMEYSTAGLKFPTFLIIGIIAGIFVELVVEVLRGALTIAREDLRKLKKTVLRILIATSIGLLAGIILDFAAIWAAFPLFCILGVLLGATFGITIEVIRYHRLMNKAFLEGKGLGMEQLPVSTAELIRLVIKKMRYHKEVRTEVMAELAAHFEDELKDCVTDEAKEQKAKELIAEFGDAKLLAVLLRRAKKRCRPLWRTMVARTFQAVGALILCIIVYAVWFSTGKPTISVDYLALLNQLSRPEVRDEDNAWPHYEQAIELYIEPDQRILELTARPREDFRKRFYFSDLNKNKQDMFRKWLKENESDWNSLELSQKQLFEKCFNEGLVPYLDLLPVYMRVDKSRRYCVFDYAVKDFIWRIERQQASGKPVNLPEYLENEMMIEMEMERGGYYGGGFVVGRDYSDDPQIQRKITMDLDIPLDSEVISLFGSVTQKELSVSQEELKKIKRGINAGVIKEWIDSPPVAAKSLFDYLLPFEKKLIVKWVADNETAWREFVAGSSKSYCYREFQHQDGIEDKLLWNIGISHFNSIKRLTRVGIWRSRIGLDQGQIQQSIDDCVAVAKAGSHWQGRGTIVEQLVGLSIVRIAYDEIFPILATQRFSADQLKRLQNQLSQFYPQGYPLIDMEGERIAFMDTIQRLFTDGGPGGGHLIPQKTGMFGDMYEGVVEIADDIPVGKKIFESAALTSMCLLHARRDATVSTAERIYEQQVEIVGMSPYERHKRDVGSIEDVYLSMPKYRYVLLKYLMPAVERISELLYQGKALHEATIAILAIQRWRLEKEEYPATLDELIEAGYLKELPKDPYSDKTLIYKKTGDNFVLYSIGRNFEDDGGKVYEKDGDVQKWGAHDDGDWVFWPMSKQ
ncbi:MAG: hypothetical protein H8D56_14160 [Planctomycetes bacterium]|nr:hypothetical protein [Planctomycetota bacterium]MBL7145605.1 hypothetical protein [Phycisphaerae bacterium]